MELRSILLATTLFVVGLSHGQWQSLNGGLDHFVRCFEINSDSSSLLVGGSFDYVMQDSLGAAGIASWDGATWSIAGLAPPPDSLVPLPQCFRVVLSICQSNDSILMGFTGGCLINPDPAMVYANVLANGTWQPFGTPDYVPFFLKANGRVFIGGDNTDTIFAGPVNGVCEWRGGAVQQLKGNPFTLQQDILAATYWNGTYYFGGNTWGELGSPDIVAYDGDSLWSGVGGGMGPGWLQTIAGFGDSLYVGGYFLQGGNNMSTHIQLFDGTQWKPFFPQVEYIGQVWDIQSYEGSLYIWGTYHFQGESTTYALLRFDGRELCALGGPMDVAQSGGMAFFQNNLYAPLYSWYPGLEDQWIGRLPLDGLVPDTCITVVGTGVPEHAEATLALYPNPGKEHLSLTAPANAWPAEVEVRDGTGRVVHRERLTANTALAASAWAAGTYTVQLRGSDGSVRRATWVKVP